MVRRLAAMAWPDLAATATRRILAVPPGSTEQHGPHLLLGTDTTLAVAVTDRLAALRPDVVIFGHGGNAEPLAAWWRDGTGSRAG